MCLSTVEDVRCGGGGKASRALHVQVMAGWTVNTWIVLLHVGSAELRRHAFTPDITVFRWQQSKYHALLSTHQSWLSPLPAPYQCSEPLLTGVMSPQTQVYYTHPTQSRLKTRDPTSRDHRNCGGWHRKNGQNGTISQGWTSPDLFHCASRSSLQVNICCREYYMSCASVACV